jgi:hypothetical protein
MTTSFTHLQLCPECVALENNRTWRDQPMNEAIRDYAKQYISTPKLYYADLDAALTAWGEQFNPEDYL